MANDHDAQALARENDRLRGEDLRYLVRRFEHETGVRVGSLETIEECMRARAGALMSIKVMHSHGIINDVEAARAETEG